MPFLNSSQQTPLKTQKVSVYIDWGFGQGRLLEGQQCPPRRIEAPVKLCAPLLSLVIPRAQPVK